MSLKEDLLKGKQLLILYGSETGTAQEVAERVGREGAKYSLSTHVMPMNDANLTLVISNSVIVFVAATTGQGDDPENMKIFFQVLWKMRNNRKLLVHLKYGVLGLGDSSYQKFNFAAKRLNNLLTYLGATQVLPIGLADDQHDFGPDFVVDSWLNNLWTTLTSIFALPIDIYHNKPSLLPSKFEAIFCDNQRNGDVLEITNHGLHANYNSEYPYYAEVVQNTRKTSPDHFQDVRLIELNIEDINIKHKPGDVIVIKPKNLEENVDLFLILLGLDGTKMFKLKMIDPSSVISTLGILPQPCTIRQCVTNYFDIQSVPKRYFFELLSFFTENELEKEKFVEFSSSEGREELYNYCNRPKRSILEVFADFPNTSKNIPFNYLFDLIPPIRPRSYSIASSSLALPGKAQILVAAVNYKTILKKPRLGLCSNWLARLKIKEKVPVWIKTGSLKFPGLSLENFPALMIGPGTGCAPFRAFIQECAAMENSNQSLTLLFGCRGKDKDFFFKDEWEDPHNIPNLEVFCAFSRDQDAKIYVQHIMKKNLTFLWNLIGNLNAYIYYAGNAKRIPIDVYESLEYICKNGGAMTDAEAKKYMKNNIEKRYQIESWV